MSAICEAIDLSIAIDDGEKLNDSPDDVGDVSLQSMTHRTRASDAAGDLSRLRALSQHFIDILAECNGIPANTPPAKAMRSNSDVAHLVMLFSRYGKSGFGVKNHFLVRSAAAIHHEGTKDTK